MLRILVVEDDFDIQELLQNYLENEGYQVISSPTARRIWCCWI